VSPDLSLSDFRHELRHLAVRVAALQAETVEIVADTREIVRRSRELVARLQADADRPVFRPAPSPSGRSNSSRTPW
jgi:hypothetical protein